MQDHSLAHELWFGNMVRTSTKLPGSYGQHLASLREAAGLTQVALAERLGVHRSNIGFWERWDKPPRGDVLPRLAQALGVTLEDLLQTGAQLKMQHPPIKGKLQKVFEEASRLPRRQQQKILDIIEPFIQKHKAA